MNAGRGLNQFCPQIIRPCTQKSSEMLAADTAAPVISGCEIAERYR
jgi:hypothetical protein